MIFRNARLCFPDGIRDGLEVEARNGKITAIRGTSDAPGDSIDLKGNYLAPGFVDLHIHGALGCDTMEASAEAFEKICQFHASGGTTSLLLTTATAPMKALLGVLGAIKQSAGKLPQIAGAHIEGPYLSKKKPGAQRVTLMRNPFPKTYAPLLEHSEVIKRVTIAPELPGALQFIDDLVQNKIGPSGGHSDAWEEDVKLAFEHGMHSVMHTFNCMSSSRRRGIDRVAGMLEFALGEPNIICELIADGHHVSPTLMKMLYRAKGARGICLVTDATAGAGMPNGSKFSLYGKKCIVDDSVCFLADRSALAGSASRMIDLVRTMVTRVGVPLHEAIAMATDTPAHAIGLTAKGQFKIGGDADFVVITPDIEVERTFIGRTEVFNANIRAKF